jgi:hypothetical protein
LNIVIKETFNDKEINEILLMDGVREFLFKNASSLDFNYCNYLGIKFIGMYDGDNICGIAAVKKITDKECVVDLGISKAYRGKLAINLCKKCIEFIFKNLSCSRILGMVMRKNRKCKFFLRMIGFSIFKKNDDYLFFELVNN